MSETLSPATPDILRIKEAMRNTWMAGDFGVIARTIEGAADEFAVSLDLIPGMRVLDVATGTGNVAVPLARVGCIVTGVDIAPNLLEQARERAAADDLAITFDEGDAEQLPYADASFDVITTMFGAMFAPRPERVAAEFARVLKPGGLLAMANWNPASFVGALFRATSPHVPPPPGVPSAMLWGDDATVNQRLAAEFTDIQTEIVPIDFDLPMPPAGAADLFRTFYGPTKMAFSKLDEAGQAALAADLEATWIAATVAPDPATHTLVPHQYMKVTARRV